MMKYKNKVNYRYFLISGRTISRIFIGKQFLITIMNLELVAQLVSLFFILGAGPIVVVLLFARGGNL